MPTEEDVVNQVTNQKQVSVTTESHTMNFELHSGTELHSEVKLENEEEVHSDF